ncbi:MAG: hypothetical protein JWN44_6383 [Myxococcales bacterium]|nr:hypothetical protein [Myxococcales bacterium]
MNGQLPSQPGRLVQWMLLGGAVLAFSLAWWGVRSTVRVGDVGTVGSAGGTDPTPGAPATTDSEERRKAVEAIVAARNRDNGLEAEKFRNAGWSMVAAEPPDARLTALDPALLEGRERELRVQIASTVAAPELASRLKHIAMAARESATRVAAVEALGRMGTREAQSELLALLPSLPADDDARQQIVPLLRPHALDDEFAGRLAAQLDGATLTMVEKKQLAFTLALVGLRDGMKLRGGTASPSAQKLIDQMAALAQRGTGEEL